ncbi:MAG TPA: hypothetical protein VGC76_10980 [Pyrinomonadaceae bacterium]|jgi:hypothetical protein
MTIVSDEKKVELSVAENQAVFKLSMWTDEIWAGSAGRRCRSTPRCSTTCIS